MSATEKKRRAKNFKLSEAALARARQKNRDKNGSFYVIAPNNINRTLLTNRVAAIAHAQHMLKKSYEKGDPPPGDELAVVKVVARVRYSAPPIEVVWED